MYSVLKSIGSYATRWGPTFRTHHVSTVRSDLREIDCKAATCKAVAEKGFRSLVGKKCSKRCESSSGNGIIYLGSL